MDEQLHPLEAAWRRFRGGEGGTWLRESLALRTNFCKFVGRENLPNEVVLPSVIPLHVLSHSEGGTGHERKGRRLAAGDAAMHGAHDISVWAAYRDCKTIYEVETPLIECLSRTPWPDRVPVLALRLPSRCPVLDFRFGGGRHFIAVNYDILSGGETTGQLELRLSWFEAETGHWLPISVLHLVGEDLGECARTAAFRMERGGPSAEEVASFHSPWAGLVLTILLYLAGEPDVVRVTHPGEKPFKNSLRKRDPERFQDLDAPKLRRVGSQFRRAIERWEIEHRRDPDILSGRVVRPHMRRAHAHLYWTGPGREQPRLKFLLPIAVKGSHLAEEPERPTETKVA